VSTDPFYDLKEPTTWAQPPRTYSFSSVEALRACPRRWQLVHSGWGQHPRFPERPQPATIEGQIVHEALDLLARQLGRAGRPLIASSGFRAAIDRCGFWTFFVTQVDDWNRRLASHPRAGPRYVLRTKPRDLANQAVRLFRERYQPGRGQPVDVLSTDLIGVVSGTCTPLSLLEARGALSEIRIEHPSLPLVGVLDLVALERDGSTTVVDFKTGIRKPAHEKQILLCALLWWRVAGVLPCKAVVQYLDSNWVISPKESALLATENAIAKEIDEARVTLLTRPAPAKPGQECEWCPVRPRCNEGWTRGVHALNANNTSKPIDLEVTVSSNPTSTGFLGMCSAGNEVSLVYDAAVGCGLPPTKIGDCFRIVDAVPRAGGKEIALLPWTEMYRL